MNNTEPLQKVTAFVTRDRADASELLVFRHPTSGVQIPAGTVEENEEVTIAVRREVWEETGLDEIELASYLGVQKQTMQDERVVLRRVPLLATPLLDASEAASFPTFLGLRRGLYVRQIGESADGYAPVVYEEFDSPAHASAVAARSITGWVPTDSITPEVHRHFFHFRTPKATPDTWIQTAEEWNHRFELFWVPLSRRIAELVPMQAEWLDEFADRLLDASE